MISDVLRDAIEDIEDYQRELPLLYEPVAEDLRELKEKMAALVEKLNKEVVPL